MKYLLHFWDTFFRAGFLNFRSIDILDWIILYCGRTVLHLAGYLLASLASQKYLQTCQISPEGHFRSWLRTTNLEDKLSLRFILCLQNPVLSSLFFSSARLVLSHRQLLQETLVFFLPILGCKRKLKEEIKKTKI